MGKAKSAGLAELTETVREEENDPIKKREEAIKNQAKLALENLEKAKADMKKLSALETEANDIQQKINETKQRIRNIDPTLIPEEPAALEKKTRAKRGSKKAETEAALPKVLAATGKTPQKIGDIAAAAGVDKPIATAAMKQLLEAGKVSKRGEKAATVYTAK